jgi:hypothetical protein
MVTIAQFARLRASKRAKPSGLSGHFFLGMSAGRQAKRIRELAGAGLSPDLIALITERGIDAVRRFVAS